METYTIEPELFGMRRTSLSQLVGGDPEQNAAIAREVLAGKKGPHRDAVLLNAGAAIAAAGLADDIADGITHAAEAIDSGGAAAKLDGLVKLTNA